MKLLALAPVILFIPALAVPMPARAQDTPSIDSRIARQQKAMEPLRPIDGLWRGTTTEYKRDGSKSERGYSERVTPILDGTLKLLEGRKQSVDGEDDFHVVCLLSHDPEKQQYVMRAYWPEGYVGDVLFTVDAGNFGWRIERPDGSLVVATGAIRDDVWRERIELVAPREPPRLLEERVLRRVGN